MEQYFVLYNSLEEDGIGEDNADALWVILDKVIGKADITKITNYQAYLADKEEYKLVICGGAGTLNRFVNDTEGLVIKNRIYYYATGNDNELIRDLGINTNDMPVEITEYIKELPVCELNGKKYRFLHEVGYGIDGYCCEVANKLKKVKKKINYTLLAIKGLLYAYKPTGARITVDGNIHRFEKVWLAPTILGKYYGGGIMPTPNQKRTSKKHKVSVCIFHDCGRVRSLMIFSKIFKGTYLKYEKNMALFEGEDIIVEFDEPRSVQMDGVPFFNVKKYCVHSYRENEIIWRRGRKQWIQ